MPCRRTVTILLIEGCGTAFGELETLGVNRHEKVARPSGNHLASEAEALASH
jgi:hypothetical protein